MRLPRGRWVVRIATLAIVTVLVVAAARRLDLARFGETLVEARSVWLVAACVCYVAILPLWALQWALIAPRTPQRTWRRMLGVVALTSTALNTTPLLIGEVAGATLLVTQIGLTPSAAFSVSVMDQLLVGVGKIAVIAGAALTNPLPLWMTRGLVTLAVVVFLACTLCLAIALNVEAQRWPLVQRLPERVRAGLSTFATSLEPLRKPRLAIAAVTIALIKRGVELLAILAVQHAFGAGLSPSSALLVLAVLNLATLVPIVPGNLGVYEGVVTAAYLTLGISPERAAAMAIAQHACYFVSLALPGYVWLAFTGESRRAVATP